MMNELSNSSTGTEVTATILMASSKEMPQVSALVEVLRGVGQLAGQAADVRARSLNPVEEQSSDIHEQERHAFLNKDISELLREKIVAVDPLNPRRATTAGTSLHRAGLMTVRSVLAVGSDRLRELPRLQPQARHSYAAISRCLAAARKESSADLPPLLAAPSPQDVAKICGQLDLVPALVLSDKRGNAYSVDISHWFSNVQEILNLSVMELQSRMPESYSNDKYRNPGVLKREAERYALDFGQALGSVVQLADHH